MCYAVVAPSYRITAIESLLTKVGFRITCVPLFHVIYSPLHTTRNNILPTVEFSDPSAPLQLRVFLAAPPRLVDQVLGRIQFNLLLRGGDEIDA